MSNGPRLPVKRSQRDDVPVVPLALLTGLICVGGFFGLLAIIFPGIGFLGIGVLLLGFFFWLQYFIWGKWIYGYAVRKEQEAEARESLQKPNDAASAQAGEQSGHQ